jgi:predicted nucleic acid-binding Zn ribbon protein
MTDIDAIFAADRRHPPHERSLPWQEIRDGITVVIEPKPHWATDMRAFRSETCEYCAYADWAANGVRARFFGHIDICGDDLIRKARALVADEIANEHWS